MTTLSVISTNPMDKNLQLRVTSASFLSFDVTKTRHICLFLLCWGGLGGAQEPIQNDL